MNSLAPDVLCKIHNEFLLPSERARLRCAFKTNLSQLSGDLWFHDLIHKFPLLRPAFLRSIIRFAVQFAANPVPFRLRIMFDNVVDEDLWLATSQVELIDEFLGVFWSHCISPQIDDWPTYDLCRRVRGYSSSLLTLKLTSQDPNPKPTDLTLGTLQDHPIFPRKRVKIH